MDNNTNKKPTKTNMPKFNLNWLYMIIAMMLLGLYLTNESGTSSKNIPYDEFQEYVRNGYISKVTGYDDNSVEAYVKPQYVPNVFKADSSRVGKNPLITTEAPSRESLGDFLQKEKDETRFDGSISYEKKRNYFGAILWQILPFAFLIGFWIFLSRRWSGGGGMGGGSGIFSVGKSKAQLFEKNSPVKVTFKDVAGLAEAKQEVEEIVEFLKQPQKYTDLGGKIPKGALLVGPPGTGKTLLAKAVAGEANVPFFSLAGSDFVEMFVGVGASRVRDLFRQAKEKAPCIVFIDEIDAVGRARAKAAAMGGNDERENTLNQLLTEMDGFGSNSGVIILAATNRVDVLDKALLRAGRFDRQIHVDLPDVNERKEVFGVHLRPIKIDNTVDVELLARQTPGFSGADIANVCNEAALIAARHGKKFVEKQDFLDAVDRIVGGLEKKTKITTEEERRSIAIHEAGHASISWLLEYANPLIKVTIVPRGRALGAAWYLPEERQITTKEQMLDEMCATLGGRAAEDLFLGRISTGAMNDLERVTKQAYGMIAYLGMSDKLPNLCYYNNEEYSFNRPYSEKTAELIDEEVKRMVNEQYERAKKILSDNKDGHNQLAQQLIDKEVIFAEDVEAIFGKRPWASRSEEIISASKTSKELKEADYTHETWVKYEEALEAANGIVADNSNKTQAEVDAAKDALKAAKEALVKAPVDPQLDKSKLQAAVDAAKAKDENAYTTASYNAMEKVLAEAEELLTNGKDQAAIDAKAKDLNDAVAALVERGNTDALKALIAEYKAEGLKEADYTTDSWKAYTDALTAAEKVVKDNSNLDQAAVDAALNALRDARVALKLSGKPSVDKSELQAAYDKYKDKKNDGYTAESWAKFENALKSAKAILDNEAATADQVKAVLAQLNSAAEGLTKTQTPPKNDPQTPSTPSQGGSVQTGDTAHVALWLVLAGMSVIAYVAVRRKRA